MLTAEAHCHVSSAELLGAVGDRHPTGHIPGSTPARQIMLPHGQTSCGVQLVFKKSYSLLFKKTTAVLDKRESLRAIKVCCAYLDTRDDPLIPC